MEFKTVFPRKYIYITFVFALIATSIFVFQHVMFGLLKRQQSMININGPRNRLSNIHERYLNFNKVLQTMHVTTNSHGPLVNSKVASETISVASNLQERSSHSSTAFDATRANHTPPVRNVVFLKVHKAASSTVQNILLRFGMKRNLTFLLPRKTNIYPNVIDFYESISDKNTIPRRGKEEFNIMCCHVIYNRTVFQKYFPPESVYIAIVREPYQRFVSWMAYFEKRNIQTLNRKNTSFCDHLTSRRYDPRHRMAVEFGFPRHLLTQYNRNKTEKYLNQLNDDFRLVLVVEYFHESLVLLRRMLRWSTKDIIYMKINDNRKKVIFNNNNKTCADLYYSKVQIDVHLYEFFYKEFWRKIRNEGSDFELEVLHLNKIQKQVEQFCSSKSNAILYVEALPWSDNFYVTQKECNILSLFEGNFIELVRKKQYANTIYA